MRLRKVWTVLINLDAALFKVTELLDDKVDVVRDCHLSLDELHEVAEESSKLQHTLLVELLLVHRNAQIGKLDLNTKRLLAHEAQLVRTEYLTTTQSAPFSTTATPFAKAPDMTDQGPVMCGACPRNLLCNARYIQTCKAIGPTHVHSAVFGVLKKGLRTAGLRQRRFYHNHNQVNQRPDFLFRGMLPSQNGDALAGVVVCRRQHSSCRAPHRRRRSKYTKFGELAQDSKVIFVLAMSSLGPKCLGRRGNSAAFLACTWDAGSCRALLP